MIIMSVDPGVGHMGIAIIQADETVNTMTVIKRFHIEGQKLIRQYKDLRQTYPEKFIVQVAYRELFKTIMTDYNVDEVVSEGAFAFIRIAAFESLVKVISTLQMSMYELGKGTLHVVSPQFVKKAWTGSGDKDVGKEEMRQTYYRRTDVLEDGDKTTAVEHEIDAIAHGFAWLSRDIWKTVLQNPPAKKKRKKEKQG